MTNEQRIKELEDLILTLDSTFADLESARRKGYLTRDLPLLRKAANEIYRRRYEKRA